MVEPYFFVLLVSLLFLAYQITRLWSLRRTPGAVELLLGSLASEIWAIAYTIEILIPGLAEKLFWAKVQYIGIAPVSVLMYLFMVCYTGRERQINSRQTAVLFIIPVLTIVIAFTNDSHALLWSSVALQPGLSSAPLTLGHGWWFWVIITYSYLALGGATFLLVRFIFSAQRQYRVQMLIMLAALFSPWLGNALYVLGFQPGPHLDLTPVAFALTNIGLTLGFVRFKLLDILPVAYSSIFQFLSDGVIVLDAQHRIVDLNPAARQVFSEFSLGLPSQAEDTSTSNDPFVGFDLNDLLPNWVQALNSEKEIVSIQGPEREPGQLPKVYSLRATPILNQRAQGTGHIIIFTDISLLRRAEDQVRLQALALESTENAIVITDPQGCINWVNPAFTHLTGYTREETIGENSRILKSGKQEAQFYQTLWKTISSGGVWRGEIINRRKDGSLYNEEMTITPMVQTDGTIPHYIAVKQDISDRKQAEETLRLAHEQAVESNRLKTQLLANVSQDMRTPLSAITGFIEMLQANVYGEVAPDQVPVILEIQDSAHELLLFVNNLIGQAQFETGKIILNPQLFLPQELVEACQASLGFTARKKELQLQFAIDLPGDRPIFGDPYWLRQILLNLVSNALKYTRRGLVKIHIFCPDAQHWAIEVIDTGMGIPRDVQEAIFEPFRQVDSSIMRERTGAGLGLAIVKELTHLMAGEISLASWPGVGSTFSVSFPASKEGESAAANPQVC
jgi:PAS domain S-box-containing protein